MFYALEQFEGEFAVMVDDNKQSVAVPKNKIPPYAEPGMVFKKVSEGYFVYQPQETKLRRERIINLQDELFM